MNNDLTTFENIINEGLNQFTAIVRNTYLRTIDYIHQQVPEFVLNDVTVTRLDANMLPAPRYTTEEIWNNFLISRDNCKAFINSLAIYKNKWVGLYIEADNRVYIRFDIVNLKGYRICPYYIRTWKRENIDYRYYERNTIDEELTAFKLNRVPTSEEFYSTNNFHEIYHKLEQNIVQLAIKDNLSLADQIEAGYLKYLKSAKSSKTFEANSKLNTYNQYVKYRANPLLEIYRNTHNI